MGGGASLAMRGALWEVETFEMVATVTDGPVVAMMQALMRVRRRLLEILTDTTMEMVRGITMKRIKPIIPPTKAPIRTSAVERRVQSSWAMMMQW